MPATFQAAAGCHQWIWFSMWTGRFFGRVKDIGRTTDPAGCGTPARADLESGEVAGGGVLNDPYRHDDLILDLLGSHLDDGSTTLDREEQSQSSVNGSGLLDALYAHYCRALDTPQSLMAGAWVPSRLPMGGGATDPASQGVPPIVEDTGGVFSDMFSDIECIDQAFGPLRPGLVPDAVEHAGVPEILRLFAPPEYRAKDRSEAIRPPALTQREHHTLAIDSPLPELGGVKRETEAGNS